MGVLTPVENIMISLESRYADGILSGNKIYELRRRRFNVEEGSRIWLYSKKPLGAVVGFATIRRIHGSSLAAIWRKYGALTGVTRKEFFAYFSGKESAYAIELAEQHRLKFPLSLEEIRCVSPGFQPPQFFKKLSSEDMVLSALQRLK